MKAQVSHAIPISIHLILAFFVTSLCQYYYYSAYDLIIDLSVRSDKRQGSLVSYSVFCVDASDILFLNMPYSY